MFTNFMVYFLQRNRIALKNQVVEDTSTHGDGFHNCRCLLECVPKTLKPCLQQAKGILHNPLHAGQLVAVDPLLRNLPTGVSMASSSRSSKQIRHLPSNGMGSVYRHWATLYLQEILLASCQWYHRENTLTKSLHHQLLLLPRRPCTETCCYNTVIQHFWVLNCDMLAVDSTSAVIVVSSHCEPFCNQHTGISCPWARQEFRLVCFNDGMVHHCFGPNLLMALLDTLKLH